ncbi:uncharacterized protein BO80DRAFT_502029 [Aspergillus ibericus CBS 121593]|uniref:Uncharacterized protein n=1 Tax=Aspergillus ibericus CBS 121593 TaxID=1448316 RepID=A0A395H0A8_9EURO|nr:hypothetical protein BO80DRAFT_502029 [Aspergillus ibericus CBS 121593]RAL01033.1 hypothetical protein BO80DRAFT_502029 [Aspergillus ibericus CBS 121593]
MASASPEPTRASQTSPQIERAPHQLAFAEEANAAVPAFLTEANYAASIKGDSAQRSSMLLISTCCITMDNERLQKLRLYHLNHSTTPQNNRVAGEADKARSERAISQEVRCTASLIPYRSPSTYPFQPIRQARASIPQAGRAGKTGRKVTGKDT